MPDKQLTESEIMKALECCKMPVGSCACNHCHLKETREKRLSKEEKSCTTILLENALDLINRKNDEADRFAYYFENAVDAKLKPAKAEARAEAIKEFAERVKKAKTYSVERHENIVPISVIDWIAKEMGCGE